MRSHQTAPLNKSPRDRENLLRQPQIGAYYIKFSPAFAMGQENENIPKYFRSYSRVLKAIN